MPATIFPLRRRSLLAGGIAALAFGAAAPARALGSDAPEPMVQAVLALFEPSGGREGRAAFHAAMISPGGRRRWPLPMFEEVFGAIAAVSGGFDLVGAEREGSVLWLRLSARRQQVERTIRARIDRDDATRFYDISASPMPVRYNGPAPTGPIAAAALPGLIDRRIAFAAARDEFSGACRVVSPAGEVVYERAVGRARRVPDVANTTATRFHLGSADKSFTAIIIASLVAEGRLGFDDPLASVLPDYANAEFARGCTIRHLLSHSAGLGMLWDRPDWENRRPYESVTEMLPAFAAAPPAFAPGTGAAYSNEGFVVLGAVAERLTGRNWYDLLAERIYTPAGMEDSGHFLYQQLPERVATGYRYSPEDHLGLNEREVNDDFLGYRGNSCGGGYATVRDMTAYLRVLRAGQLVDKRLADKLVTQQPSGLGGYGLGFEVFPLAPERTVIGHSGSGAHTGIDGRSGIVWETGWAYSVLGNYDSPFAKTIADDIAGLLAMVG